MIKERVKVRMCVCVSEREREREKRARNNVNNTYVHFLVFRLMMIALNGSVYP